MLLARAHETVAAVAGGLGVSLGPIDRQTDRQNLQRAKTTTERTNERTNEGLKALFPRSHTHAHTHALPPSPIFEGIPQQGRFTVTFHPFREHI